MRLRLLCLGLGAALLLVTGFRPATLPYIPGAPYSDAALSHWPAALFLRESVLERGEFPLWRDGIMASQPFAANPLNKTAYPLQWLALLFPPTTHLDIMILLHLTLAGAGMWRWARALGIGAAGAALAGLGYALAPRLLAHTGAGHLDLVYACAWWPWLMWSVRPAVQSQAPVAAALRVSLFAALVVLADARLSLFALALAAAYGLFEAASIGRLRASLRLLWALPVFLLLIAGVVAPLLGWQPWLSRAALTPDDAGVFSLATGQLLGLAGLPVDGGNQETLTFVGLPVLLLAVVGLWTRRRERWFWLAALVLAGWYALGTNGLLWHGLARAVPALLWFRVPARAWFVVALLMPLLAGFGWDALQPALQRPRAPARWSGLLLAVSLAAAVALFAMPPLRTASLHWLICAGVALVLLLAVRGRLSSSQLGLLLVMLVFADLTISGLRWLSWRPVDAAVDTNTAALISDARRVYAPYFAVGAETRAALSQPAAAALSLSLFGGVDPFQLTGIRDAALAASGQDAGGYSVVAPPVQVIDNWHEPVGGTDTGVLARWGVERVVSPVPLAGAGLRLLNEDAGRYIYAVEGASPGNLNALGWPDGWPALPDTATVEKLNQMTFAAWLVSIMTVLGVIDALILLRRRSRNA